MHAADVVRAIEANRDRFAEHGGDAFARDRMLEELGFGNVDELRVVLAREGEKWVMHLPVGATVVDVAQLVAGAYETALAAGVRLGKFNAGEPPSDPSDPRGDDA